MPISKLRPVVGYPGSKYRILDRIRPFLVPEEIQLYVEPFVGMGAVYLDLRARGYKGPAILADSNPEIANFWRFVHDERGPVLLEHCRKLDEWPRTTEAFREMKVQPVEDPVERVARFLWLTRFSYGNEPPLYTDNGWSTNGDRFESEYKYGKSVLWINNINWLGQIIGRLSRLPCTVESDGICLLSRLNSSATVYGDPPYRGKRPYNRKPTGNEFVQALLGCSGRRIIVSEQTAIVPLPDGWRDYCDLMTIKMADRSGCSGKRTEYLYVKG
jgi:site-specific DNA-adenine methylase